MSHISRLNWLLWPAATKWNSTDWEQFPSWEKILLNSANWKSWIQVNTFLSLVKNMRYQAVWFAHHSWQNQDWDFLCPDSLPSTLPLHQRLLCWSPVGPLGPTWQDTMLCSSLRSAEVYLAKLPPQKAGHFCRAPGESESQWGVTQRAFQLRYLSTKASVKSVILSFRRMARKSHFTNLSLFSKYKTKW